jgi:hypothetical protein
MDIDLNDYVAGGYFITKYAEREKWMSADLLPERVISISRCIGKKLEIYWGWDLDQNQQEIENFGIPASKLQAFADWIKQSNHIGFPDVFYTLDAAHQLVAEFLDLESDIALIGIGLSTDMVDSFLVENKQISYDRVKQTSHDDLYGVNYVLHHRKQLSPDSKMLGFEVVAENSGLSCSWLCSGLEKDMHKLFGIHPNQHGLIDSYADAKKVYEWIAEDEMQGTRAEPEPYYPWLIVQYPL